MEASDVAPNAYAVDSSLFTPVVIGGRIQQTIPKESFRKDTVSVRHKEHTRWIFTCSVRIRRYGKVRFAIIYDNPDKKGLPKYIFRNMLIWRLLLGNCRWTGQKTFNPRLVSDVAELSLRYSTSSATFFSLKP